MHGKIHSGQVQGRLHAGYPGTYYQYGAVGRVLGQNIHEPVAVQRHWFRTPACAGVTLRKKLEVSECFSATPN